MNQKLLKIVSVLMLVVLALGITNGFSIAGAAVPVPLYLWHTFYGSDNYDSAACVATDSSGNIYVAGGATKSWNGPTGQLPKNPYTGTTSWDMFVMKLDKYGAYQWHTFYGTPAKSDSATSIAVGSTGDIYLTGFSEASWNGPGSVAPRHAFTMGDTDLFVMKLDNDGEYVWHTFYGTALDDNGQSIVLDGSNNPIITGYGKGGWTGPLGELPKNNFPGGQYDIYVLQLSTGGDYLWHTFYGPGTINYAYTGGIAIGEGGNLYIGGDSLASWNGPSGQTPLHDHSGGNEDLFVLKLESDGDYIWHTFYGSDDPNGIDYVRNISANANGDVAIAGFVYKGWLGPAGEQPKHAHNGNDFDDYEILKLDKDGNYKWHTFYGSSDLDSSRKCIIDAGGNVYLAGTSNGSWNGPAGEVPLNPYAGSYEINLLKLDSSGGYLWHTFYGSSNPDYAGGMALDPNGNIILVGESDVSSWNGPGGKPPLHPVSGSDENVIIKLAKQLYSTTFTSTGTQDGWVLESGENTLVGGTMNSSLTTLRLGDDAAKKQYRSILSFTTSSLPDSAVITKVTLKVRKQGILGVGNPVTIFQGFMVDVRKGPFGIAALQLTDWQATAGKTVGPSSPIPVSEWYSLNLTGAKAFINQLATGAGLTQVRLRFKLDDNGNGVANVLNLYSGDAGTIYRPQLIVEYYVP